MEGPSEKHVKNSEEQDNDMGVVSLKNKGNEDSAPIQREYGDLIVGLGNDVVLGEVMTRIPWYNRPVLNALNRSWAHAVKHSFPAYARLHHPLILSESIVLFRIHCLQLHFRCDPSNSNEEIALWVYSCSRRIMLSLPGPAIPARLQRHVKFVCDDNDECIYCFNCDLEKGVYDVEVLDLREGSSRWKSLPSLPAFTDESRNCKYHVTRCSSWENEKYSTTYIVWLRTTLMADPDVVSQWTLTVGRHRNDSKEKWQLCEHVTSSPHDIQTLNNEIPFYVAIDKHPDTTKVWRYLYRRCERLDDSHELFAGEYVSILGRPSKHWWGDNYILMFQSDQPTNAGAYSFYRIEISQSGVRFYTVKVKDESRPSIEDDEEGGRFWDYWQSRIDRIEDRNAIKVSEESMDLIGQGRGNGFDIQVNVAHRSRSLYLYRLIGVGK